MNYYHYLAATIIFSLLVSVTSRSLSSLTAIEPDLDADKAVLLALRSSIRGRTLLWNTTESSPCNWAGVHCKNNRLSELRLHGMGLVGKLPENTIGNLTQLVTLSLRFNALSGSLPLDLSSLSNLRNLYLESNKYSGPIPTIIFSLKNLVRLSLASNNFSGPISSDFNKLNRLGALYLENNQLSGEIPNLDMPGLVQFNVSDNLLIGDIPVKLSSKPKSSFVGNALCGRPLNSCNESDKKSRDKISFPMIDGIIFGCGVGVLVMLVVMLVILLFVCCRTGGKKKEVRVFRSSKEFGVVQKPRENNVKANVYPGSNEIGEGILGKKLVYFGKPEKGFDLEDLFRASAMVLGKGAFGTSYRAILDTGMVAVVKTLREVTVPEKLYRKKIEDVGIMDHVNLVPLRAYFYSVGQNLLVYDYMPMGSLSALLHGNRGADRTPLNWKRRIAIALGAARGIAYIHSQGPTVSHGYIKSSNILLTASYEARVSDIGLAQLVGKNTGLNALDGYRAPEVTDPRKVTQESDVYSFGVVLLELLTGKAPTNPLLNKQGVDLPMWVHSVISQEWTEEVFDVELLKYQNVEDMVQLLQLALSCSAQYPDQRPPMTEVSQKIMELCVSGS